jgi:hypothetical protein
LGQANRYYFEMIQRLRDSDILKWFYPGMHVKRWLALMMLGV